MFVAVLNAQKFFSKDKLEELKKIPGMTWTPAIPKQFESLTKGEIMAKLMPMKLPATFAKIEDEVVGDAPAAFDSRE